MDPVVHGLDRVLVYLDNMLIASCDMEQHLQDLEEIFCRLKEAGLVINGEKCLFNLDFLGHRVLA